MEAAFECPQPMCQVTSWGSGPLSGSQARPCCAGDASGASLRESTRVELPEGYTELAPGPNPAFSSSQIYLEASSPVAPPLQLQLALSGPICLEPVNPGIPSPSHAVLAPELSHNLSIAYADLQASACVEELPQVPASALQLQHAHGCSEGAWLHRSQAWASTAVAVQMQADDRHFVWRC